MYAAVVNIENHKKEKWELGKNNMKGHNNIESRVAYYLELEVKTETVRKGARE